MHVVSKEPHPHNVPLQPINLSGHSLDLLGSEKLQLANFPHVFTNTHCISGKDNVIVWLFCYDSSILHGVLPKRQDDSSVHDLRNPWAATSIA